MADDIEFQASKASAIGKRAGRRHCTHFEIDNPRLFHLLADSAPGFVLIYEHAPEIVLLVCRYGFLAAQVTVTNIHHGWIWELEITSGYTWSTTAEVRHYPVGINLRMHGREGMSECRQVI